MDLQLKYRIALVTCGSKGIGASIVRRLSKEGAKVILCARTSPAMTELKTEVCATGGDCIALPVDVFDVDEIKKLGDAARKIKTYFGVDF